MCEKNCILKLINFYSYYQSSIFFTPFFLIYMSFVQRWRARSDAGGESKASSQEQTDTQSRGI